jgi:nicotinate phosphoribosyltransferase
MATSYKQNLMTGALFTDQYQLTMAQVYYRLGLHNTQVQFDHFFRDYPDYGSHKAGYCINAGMEWLIDWIQSVRFSDADLEALSTQKDLNEKPIFDQDFLYWLKQNVCFTELNISAIPEGRVVHPNVPVTVIQGPIIIAQLLETALLNQLNFQILIATKASRIHQSGQGQPLLEFGTRRGHDIGANAGVRAALIGGADYSSNVGTSFAMDLPPKGTHSHSMIQFFISLGMSELEAFEAFAESYPDNCILLVDTINTLESGVPNAIKVFEKLRRKGYSPRGIRLDSGDLAYLSLAAAKMLNNAGFPDVSVVLSNELDELNIWQILTQICNEAPQYGIDADHLINRLVYGVGTRLITSAGCGALGGIYKLVATRTKDEWLPIIKMSENVQKIPNPGVKTIWRLYDKRQKAIVDLMGTADESLQDTESVTLRHPSNEAKKTVLHADNISQYELLLTDIQQNGKIVYEFPTLAEMRAKRIEDIERLDQGVKRLIDPHIYHVSLTQKLWSEKQGLIRELQES